MKATAFRIDNALVKNIEFFMIFIQLWKTTFFHKL